MFCDLFLVRFVAGCREEYLAAKAVFGGPWGKPLRGLGVQGELKKHILEPPGASNVPGGSRNKLPKIDLLGSRASDLNTSERRKSSAH